MPLRCLDPYANRSVLAFDLSPEEWRALKLENEKIRRLKMTCCDAQVTLRENLDILNRPGLPETLFFERTGA